jgi:hypothetical protein
MTTMPETETEDQGYVAGRRLKVQGAKRVTVVFSVRLPAEDFAQIEEIADAEGRTPAQVVRDAIRSYAPRSTSATPDDSVGWYYVVYETEGGPGNGKHELWTQEHPLLWQHRHNQSAETPQRVIVTFFSRVASHIAELVCS